MCNKCKYNVHGSSPSLNQQEIWAIETESLEVSMRNSLLIVETKSVSLKGWLRFCEAYHTIKVGSPATLGSTSLDLLYNMYVQATPLPLFYYSTYRSYIPNYCQCAAQCPLYTCNANIAYCATECEVRLTPIMPCITLAGVCRGYTFSLTLGTCARGVITVLTLCVRLYVCIKRWLTSIQVYTTK